MLALDGKLEIAKFAILNLFEAFCSIQKKEQGQTVHKTATERHTDKEAYSHTDTRSSIQKTHTKKPTN